MIVARRVSPPASAKALAERKAAALAKAQADHGPGARVHALYAGEFYAEVPTSDPRRLAVVPIRGLEV